YVTGQSNFTVVRFAPDGHALGVFSTNLYGYSADVAFDAKGDVWVASSFGNAQLAHYGPNGQFLDQFNPDPNFAGLHSFQLGPDQRTIYYDGFADLIISTPEVGYLGRYDRIAQQALPVLYLTSTNANAP